MKVSGFSFIRNGVLLGYPFVASIKSILPIVDEFVIAVGESDDDTLSRVRAIDIDNDKIRIIETRWNERMLRRGFVYGQQKMIAQYSCTGDWAFYLEGDEIVHEEDLETIHGAMLKHLDNPDVEALYFDYYHFLRDSKSNHVNAIPTGGTDHSKYHSELRARRPEFRGDGPGTGKGHYPKALPTGAHIYHYGHVRKIDRNDLKLKMTGRYWGKQIGTTFSTYGNVDPASLRPFIGTHPKIIHDYLQNEAETEFALNPDYRLTLRDRRHRLKFWLKDRFNIDFYKRYYTAIK